MVFIETSNSLRKARSCVPIEELVANDEVKIERGANEIRDFADTVLDNDGPFDVTMRMLNQAILGSDVVDMDPSKRA